MVGELRQEKSNLLTSRKEEGEEQSKKKTLRIFLSDTENICMQYKHDLSNFFVITKMVHLYTIEVHI